MPELSSLIDAAYPDSSIHPLGSDLIQQLWDRGDPDGYAAHMTSDPLPDTPPHTVLMQIAYGDFQVTNYASAVEARTIGARAYTPALDAVRDPGSDTSSTGSRRSRAIRSTARRSSSGTAAPGSSTRPRSPTRRLPGRTIPTATHG